MSNYTVHGFVTGKVQGVYFRAFTREHAVVNDVNGWVRNVSHDQVEFTLSGNREDVMEVLSALRRGPLHAEVKKITYQDVDIGETYQGFEIKY